MWSGATSKRGGGRAGSGYVRLQPARYHPPCAWPRAARHAPSVSLVLRVCTIPTAFERASTPVVHLGPGSTLHECTHPSDRVGHAASACLSVAHPRRASGRFAKVSLHTPPTHPPHLFRAPLGLTLARTTVLRLAVAWMTMSVCWRTVGGEQRVHEALMVLYFVTFDGAHRVPSCRCVDGRVRVLANGGWRAACARSVDGFVFCARDRQVSYHML